MECSKKNFPYKSFYNDELDEVYSFYRQGFSYIIPAGDSDNYLYDRMTDRDLGQMYLVYNQALICRSSSQILFFKIVKNEITERREWKMYEVINSRGFIYYIKGNIRIQITADDKISFYLIDKKTLMPTLENVMYNYMNCSQMMFGSKVRYGITYKTNQKSFVIYRRKYEHNFKVPVASENYEGAKGLEIKSQGKFLVAKIDKVKIYDTDQYQECGELEIKLLPTETREPNEIIALQCCQTDEYLAIVSGKNLIMNEQKQNQLFIYRRQPDGEYGNFIHRVVLKDIEHFKQVSMNFHFRIIPGTSERKEILFAKIDEIFALNFTNESITTLYKFEVALKRQPQFFKLNDDQSIFVTASQEDGIYVDTTTGFEYDLDEKYEISVIKEIVYDEEDQLFYLLANKYMEKLGFFVLKIKEGSPQFNPKEDPFLIRWKNKLDIGDASLHVLRTQDRNGQDMKEIIISYKTIYINTYNVVCMDISGQEQKLSLIFRHESF